MNDAGLIVITAFISPYRNDRDAAKEVISTERFIEIHVDAPIEVCEARDPKGLYKKARAGEIPDFTGISAPYEAPLQPECHVKTDGSTTEENAEAILAALRAKSIIE